MARKDQGDRNRPNVAPGGAGFPAPRRAAEDEETAAEPGPVTPRTAPGTAAPGRTPGREQERRK